MTASGTHPRVLAVDVTIGTSDIFEASSPWMMR
jgi:hypothetical protein